MTEISFDSTPHERELISQIAQRAMGLPWPDHPTKMSLEMDITATHCNGSPLRLADLLKAEAFDFAHDIGGIRRHLNRDTGKLENCFTPRYFKQQDSFDPGAELQKAIFG
jgi:hypothetical protein